MTHPPMIHPQKRNPTSTATSEYRRVGIALTGYELTRERFMVGFAVLGKDPQLLTLNRPRFTVIDEADEMLYEDWQEDLEEMLSSADANIDSTRTSTYKGGGMSWNWRHECRIWNVWRVQIRQDFVRGAFVSPLLFICAHLFI